VSAAARVETLDGATMGTSWCVKHWWRPCVAACEPARVRETIEAVLARVVAQMSTWEPDSDLCRFNRAPAGSWHALEPEFFEVLAHALALAERSGGAYDPTIGPVVELWGFGPAPARDDAPANADLRAAWQRVGWQRLKLDPTTRSALQPGGTSVDLSSIAKGFAVDEVARALASLGMSDALVEIGGELLGIGERPDGQPWRVAVRWPTDVPGELGPVVALRGLSIATSGDEFHRFESDGRRYSHTIDPRSGAPVPHALVSVSVLHALCMQADALATTLTVLGPQAGWEFAESEGVAALFVRQGDDGLEARMTAAFEAALA
jgi:FAD:protein FMN transferase